MLGQLGKGLAGPVAILLGRDHALCDLGGLGLGSILRMGSALQAISPDGLHSLLCCGRDRLCLLQTRAGTGRAWMASALCSESKYHSRAARLHGAEADSQLWLPMHAARTLVPEEQLDRFHMAAYYMCNF